MQHSTCAKKKKEYRENEEWKKKKEERKKERERVTVLKSECQRRNGELGQQSRSGLIINWRIYSVMQYLIY